MRAREFMLSNATGMDEGTGTIKPKGSLDADQWRPRTKRQAATQQKIRDEEARHAAKLRDLKDRLP